MRRSASSSQAFMSSSAMSKTFNSYERVPGSKPVSVLQRLPPVALKLAAVGAILIVIFAAVASTRGPVDRVYGLMIDAGSTGSRMHTFAFTRDATKKLKLTTEDFFPIKPGLSSFKDDPVKAAKSIEPLLERARSLVPKAKRDQTPVFLRATAGLRLIGDEKANAILKLVRQTLRESGFQFRDDDWAKVLGGSDEGVYSWITVNYLLDRSAQDTVGTLEMGGGSAQVAFVPSEKSPVAIGNCSLGSQSVLFKDSTVPLYTYSHLSFGLKKARALILTAFRDSNMLNGNPCVNPKSSGISFPIPFDSGDAMVKMSGNGDFSSCKNMIRSVLFDSAIGKCSCDICTYNGVAAPKPILEYVAFAFYLERTVAIGMSSPMTIEDINAKGAEICSMPSKDVLDKYPNVPNGVATELCLDLAYISGHLEHGMGMKPGRGISLNVVDKIKGVELGWALGAMFAELTRLGIGK